MAKVNSASQLGYVQVESSFGVIPNSTGTATVGNSNAFRGISLLTNADQEVNERPDKNPSLSATIGIGGRKSANVTVSASLAGSGTAGTAPDIGPFLQALFGKAPTVTPATSVAYALDDLSPSLAVYNFRKPGTATQQCAFGTVVQRARFRLGENFAFVDFTCVARHVIDTDQFATVATDHKGGLTTFPSEPPSPVLNGLPAVGFTGGVLLDGQSYGTLRTAEIDLDAQRENPLDVYNNYFCGEPAQGRRVVGVQFSIYDDDSANLSSLKRKASAKTPVALAFTVGTVAGNSWVFSLANVLLASPQYDDSQRSYSVNFSGRAHASSGTAKDEITLTLT